MFGDINIHYNILKPFILMQRKYFLADTQL